VIIAHSAQQIPNFTSKWITHTITILNIYNYEQKEKKENKCRKEKGLVHLNYASLKWGT